MHRWPAFGERFKQCRPFLTVELTRDGLGEPAKVNANNWPVCVPRMQRYGSSR